MQVILASSNKGKIAEFNAFLSQYGIEVLSLADIGYHQEIIEDGNSFFENALIKAKTIYEYTKKPVISDDSGLCCAGLDGRPGIYSARYHGLTNDQDRRKKILEELKDNPNREASFHCSIVFYVDKDKYYHFEGECHGYIGYEERGFNGFGFDPIFYQANGLSFAKISSNDKFMVSHRGIAMKKFKEFVANDFSI